jgi:hypothetical protein
MVKQFYGFSKQGSLKDALKGLETPKLMILFSNEKQFNEHVNELEVLAPGIPSIGCIGMSYGGENIVENGVSIIAFTDGVTVVANVLENASTMPVKYIGRMEDDIRKVKAGSNDTVCIDFCTNNDACMVATINGVLGKKNISLVGATGGMGKVSLNGKVYEDASVYAIIKNNGGKVKVYKENIYKPLKDRFVVTKSSKANCVLAELDGKPANKVYQDALHISESEIVSQTFKNPLGKIYGNDVYIISVKEVVSGNGLSCYKQVNNSDVLALMELDDYDKIVKNTVQSIKNDLKGVSAVFSVNCIFRYLLFEQQKYFQEYLHQMNMVGAHAGLVGYGEHFNSEHVNQTMSCVAFE